MQKYVKMCEKVPLVVILGCTGAGKSQLALELARSFNGEIISADAMQMYKGLNIITNKVTEEEQKEVKHHMISVLESTDDKTIVDFRNTALPIIEDLMVQGKIPFICGGTNYYIESLLWKVLVDQDIDSNESTNQAKRKHQEILENNKKVKSEEEKENSIDNPNDDVCDTPEKVDELSELLLGKDDGSVPLEVLWERLKTIDPVRAGQLHHNERRKIWRSLQVWKQTGSRHSDILAAQVDQTGGQGPLGGGLRFPADRICIIEVWSDQETLDSRCNRRVDKMIARGMVQELIDFHQSYSDSRRLNSEREIDYTKGIFQSIGFKEFHDYLLLSAEERETEAGKKEFQKGVELLKLATRQYARRQAKWMRRRFVVSGREAPPVYRVDSSKPELWQENCYLPAQQILQAFLDGREPEVKPMERIPLDESDFEKTKKKFTCDLCNKEFKGSQQYEGHINGKRHKQELRKQLALQPPLLIKLCDFDKDKRTEVAKILKKSFDRPISYILEKMDAVPTILTKISPRSKAENLQKYLSKQGIIIQIEEDTSTQDRVPATNSVEIKENSTDL